MTYNIEMINVDPVFQSMCKRPYHNHPRGCPNYNHKAGCPPQQKLFFEVFDSDFYLIFNEFDLRNHVKRLKRKHPKWTERQLYCCLHWQGGTRKSLTKLINDFRSACPKHIVTLCPEGMGVDVTALMIDNAGIKLEWPPKYKAYQVAIAGLGRTK